MDNTDYIHFLKELENKLLSITLHGISALRHAVVTKAKLIEINVTEITRLIFFRMISTIKLILGYVKNNCGLPRVFFTYTTFNIFCIIKLNL